MEDEGVGLVLAKAVELRLKISNCIEKATAGDAGIPEKQGLKENGNEEKGSVFDGEKSPKSHFQEGFGELDEEQEQEEVDDDAETPRLLNIRDAFESLETQLIALQNLQQQQRYERELALAEIDYSRKILLEKLKDYKGKDLEVINEAAAFASETVENNNYVLLPPYPSHISRSLVLDSDYFLHLKSNGKSAPNGFNVNGSANVAKKGMNGYGRNENQTKSNNSSKGFGRFLISVAKTVLPLIGVMYVLSSSNVAPNIGKKIKPPKFLSFQNPATEEKEATIRCPPGKVLVIEDGEARCLVKERVEVPFEAIVSKPDVNYGCG